MKKGLYKDTTAEFQPKDTTGYMINWNHSKTFGGITVEEGMFLNNILNEDFVPIGKIVLDSERAIIFSRSIYDNAGPNSEIGLVDKQTYTTLVRDSLLNFQLTNQVTGTFKVNIRGEEIIYFTDNLNPIRYLNLVTLNNSVNTINGAITDLDGLRLFPNFQLGNINLISVNDVGGTLKSGVYYVTYAYLDANNNVTNFLNVSGQITVTNKTKGTASQNTAYSIYDGVNANTTTTKSFTISIDNLDASFQTIRVGIITVINQTPTVSYIDFPVNNGEVQFTFTGNETVTVGSIADITIDRPTYRTGKDITQYNSQLYIANLTGQKDLGYQKYANNIKVSYTERFAPLQVFREDNTQVANTDKDEVIIYDQLGFMDDEVYAFYLAFFLKDGSWSKAYHIPGREASTIDQSMHGLGNVSNETDTVAQVIANEQLPGGNYGDPNIKSYLDGGNYQSGAIQSKFYQVYNTSTGGSGRMGFWQNENELYPDNEDWDIFNSTGQIGTLRNTNVRHHRFPNAANLYTTKTYYVQLTSNTANGRVLGIKLSDIYIPSEIKEDIQAYGIFYAQRSTNNSLILGQGNPIFIKNTSGGFNKWPSDINRKINFSATHTFVDTGFSLSSFDVQIDNLRSPLAVFMKNEFRLTGTLDINNFTISGAPVQRFANYNKGLRINVQAAKADYVRTIRASALIPHNNATNPITGFSFGFDNTLGQRFSLYEFTPTNLGLSAITSANSLPDTSTDVPGYITNVCAYRQDIYNQFDQQLLSFTGTFITDLDSAISQEIYGGDTFYGSYGFRSTGRYNTGGSSHLKGLNFCNIKSFFNHGYRQDGPDLTTANEQDFYYPKQDTTQVLDLRPWAEEKFTVNRDYSLGNYLNPVFPKSKSVESSIEDYSCRIIRSEKDNQESLTDNFRTFLSLNYKDVPRDKGPIWRLETFNNVLLIHHKRALRRTIGTEDIKTDDISATLGTGDIFTLEPKDLIQTKEGYGGTQSQWSSIVTPYGYFFLDILSGTPLLLSEGLETINYGMLNYFKDNLDFTLPKVMKSYGFDYTNTDNPNNPYGIGTSSFYDQKYKRIIFCKRDYEPLKIVKAADYTAPFGTYAPNDLLFGLNKFYKIEFLRTNQVDTSRQIITDTLGPFSQVLTQVSLTDTEFFKDLSFTLSYYPEFKFWGSFYDFKPLFMYNDNTYCYSSIYNQIYRHNFENTYCNFYGTTYDSVVDIVSNDNLDQKTYGSITWVTRSDQGGAEITLDTFYKAIVYNSNQCSGEVPLVNLDSMRRAENQWNFNKYRDIAISPIFFIDEVFQTSSVDPDRRWYLKKKFQDRYLICRLFYNNLNQNKFILLDANSEYRRISPR